MSNKNQSISAFYMFLKSIKTWWEITCAGDSLQKVESLRVAILLKRNFHTGFFLRILRNLKEYFFAPPDDCLYQRLATVVYKAFFVKFLRATELSSFAIVIRIVTSAV